MVFLLAWFLIGVVITLVRDPYINYFLMPFHSMTT